MNCNLTNKYTTIFIVASFAVFFVCVILIIFEVVSFSYFGFGVDSNGRLYIGRGHKIEVIENGKVVNTIRNRTSRGYAFTIQRDDSILLSTSTRVYIMDLEGDTILEEWDDTGSKTFSNLKKNKYKFQTATGELYTASNPLGMLTIHKENEVVYRMPIWNYCIMVLFLLSIPCFVISIFILVRELRNGL